MYIELKIDMHLMLVYKYGHKKFNTIKCFIERGVLNNVQERYPLFGRIQTTDC